MSGVTPQWLPGQQPFKVPGEQSALDKGEDFINEFGQGINQVDVRTQNMKALEQAAMPLLLQTLMNPSSLAQAFGGAAGPVPGVPGSSLSSFLFGGPGGSTGQASPGQGYPSAPGGGLNPPTSGSPGNPITPVQPAGPQPGNPGGPNPGGAAPDPNFIGQLLGGGSLSPAQQQTIPPSLTDLMSILGQFQGVSAGAPGQPQLTHGFTGLLSGTGSPGQEVNLGLLNSMLYPQGYALGAQNPTLGAGGQVNRMMELFGPQAFRQSFTQDMSGLGSLQQLLGSLGVQFRAAGGPLDLNALTLVGEQGPELIAGTGAGAQVLPLGNQIANEGFGNNPGPLPLGASLMPGFGGNGMQNMVMPDPNIPTLPGNPLGQPTLPNPNQFPSLPNQGQGTGSIQRLLEQNPEQQAFDISKSLLMGQGGILGGGSGGQGIMAALQPLFQQNLKFGLNELTNRVPSVFNSGAAIEGADVTSRALNDYNVLAAQALQQGQQNTLGGLGILGQLAGSAGQGAFGRNLQAGQLATQRDLGLGSLGLQQQQQQWNQTVNPTLQLLLAALGMAQPTAYQTVVRQ